LRNEYGFSLHGFAPGVFAPLNCVVHHPIPTDKGNHQFSTDALRVSTASQTPRINTTTSTTTPDDW